MLLRHSLPPTISAAGESTPSSEDSICITKHNQVVRERVAGKDFEFNAGSFFQNNNGILEELVSYVKSELSPSAPAAANAEQKQYLVDTYCGSGLFAISLADRFEQVSGVEISQDSVKWAIHNAKLNGVDNATFITGSAERIFEVGF